MVVYIIPYQAMYWMFLYFFVFWKKYDPVFLIRTFFPDPDITFFLSPDPYRPKIRIQSGIFGSGSMKKNSKTVEQVENFVIFIFSTLNTILFGQVRPKPNLKRHWDPISLLMDGSGSGFLKSGSWSWSRSAKKPWSTRIRNTGNIWKISQGIMFSMTNPQNT